MTQTTSTLADAVRGRPVRVLAVDGGDATAQRLQDVGLWDGAVVELVTAAPFGDPLLFALHGFKLALRRDEARRVRTGPAEAPS